MAFDPDAYLAQKAQQPTPAPTQAPGQGFDPDAYLAGKTAPSQPGMLEAATRGAAQGATMGFEPQIAGSLDAIKSAILDGKVSLDDVLDTYRKGRDEAKASNKAASDAHPVVSTLANVLGSLPTIAATGGLGEVAGGAEALGGLARFGNAVKTGATIGGVTGLANSDADLTKGDVLGNLKDAAKGAVEGGLTGGVTDLGAGVIGSGIKGLAKSNLLKKPIQAFQQGMKGANLFTTTGADAINQQGEDAIDALGNLARTTNKDAGKALGDARAALGDRSTSILDQKTKLDETIAKLRSSRNPGADKQADALQEIADNYFKGMKQDIETNAVNPEEVVPGKPSAEDKINAAKAAMEAKENALPKGVTPSVVPSTDEAGNSFLNLLKSTPGDEEGYPNQAITKTLPNTPGVPDTTIPASLGPTKIQQVRMGGIDPNAAKVSDITGLQKGLNALTGVDGSAPALTDIDAVNATKNIAGGLGKTVDSLSPEVEAARQKSAASYQALRDLGVPDNAFRTNPMTGEKELIPQMANKFGNLIDRSGRGMETSSGKAANRSLDSAFENISQANPEGAAAVKDQVQNAALNNDLLQKANGFNLYNPSTWAKQGSILAGNAAGLTTKAVTGAFGKVAAKVGVPEMAQGARSLLATGSPNAMKLASQLGDAMKQGDTQRNATLFALMQQPGYREMLKKHIPGLGEDTQQ